MRLFRTARLAFAAPVVMARACTHRGSVESISLKPDKLVSIQLPQTTASNRSKSNINR